MISVLALQRANSYDTTGCFGALRSEPLDVLILEHVNLQRELARQPDLDQTIFRMLVEGFTLDEIASVAGVSQSTVYRRFAKLKELVPVGEVLPMLMARGSSCDELLQYDPRGSAAAA